MRNRVMLCAVMAMALAGLGRAEELSYRDALIAKYPFYKTALGSFAPVYPALAKQIVDDYGITEGVCVDLGGGVWVAGAGAGEDHPPELLRARPRPVGCAHVQPPGGRGRLDR